MKPPMLRRILTVCGVLLVVLGIPGEIFAHDDLHRDSQFLAIGMGLMCLLMAQVFIPWAQRRADRRTDS